MGICKTYGYNRKEGISLHKYIWKNQIIADPAGWTGMEKYQWGKEYSATPRTPKSTPLRCRLMPRYADFCRVCENEGIGFAEKCRVMPAYADYVHKLPTMKPL